MQNGILPAVAVLHHHLSFNLNIRRCCQQLSQFIRVNARFTHGSATAPADRRCTGADGLPAHQARNMSQCGPDMLPTYDPVDDWDAGVRAYCEAAFGREHFARMAAALLRPPLGACLRVNPLRTTTQVQGTQHLRYGWYFDIVC